MVYVICAENDKISRVRFIAHKHTSEGFRPSETPETISIASQNENPNIFAYLSSKIFSSEEILGLDIKPLTSRFSLSEVEALCIDR